MKYTKGAITERPLSECPSTCGECTCCLKYKENCYCDCTANGMNTTTLALCNPKDRSLPLPLNCYWWYAASVWKKLSPKKQADYRMERLHMFIYHKMQDKLWGSDRDMLRDHYFRQGGQRIIDAEKYPILYHYLRMFAGYPEFSSLYHTMGALPGYSTTALQIINTAADISEERLSIVNAALEKLEASARRSQTPRPGDVVEYTDQYGDYYPSARILHVEGDTAITSGHCIPEYYPSGIARYASGGPIFRIPLKAIQYTGLGFGSFVYDIYEQFQKDNRLYFSANVNRWRYEEPNPYHPGYSTKTYARCYLHDAGENTRDGNYRYESFNGPCFRNEKEFKAWCYTYRAKVFPNGEGSLAIFYYRENHKLISHSGWDALCLPESSFTMSANNNIPVKRLYNDFEHTIQTYRYCNSAPAEKPEHFHNA